MGASSGCLLMTGLSEVCSAVIASQRVAQTRGRYSFVVPAKAGTHTPCPIILDAEAETFCSNERRWLWVPAFAGTTQEDSLVKQQTRLYTPRREAPESCIYLAPKKTEGVGNAGCPLHPQPRVQR